MRIKNFRKKTLAALLAASTLTSAFSAMAAEASSADEAAAVSVSMEEIPIVAASSSVSILASEGYEEAAYATWGPVDGADGYNVYCDGVQIDSMLIRQYPGYFRADAVGLKAGSHTLKVVPTKSGAEMTSAAAETSVTSVAHDRTGFAFYSDSKALGAYNADGTLKDGAKVLYVTEETKDTVTMDVVTSSKGTTTATTGIQEILNAYKKGYDSTPIAIRIIGTVTDPSGVASMGGDLTIDGGSKGVGAITLEGIGNDAVVSGFGIKVKNMSNCEIRNIGVMLVDSDEGDNITLQQGNDHIWVHNCDMFYGLAGSDADQAKGDGALDCKKSTYVTFSYNHFWDNGKCNLLGLSEGTTEGLYISYHHNWYDHSDSRHPRVRYYSAHVYNNYYDGNAKYGIGSTLGSSVFSENNYFRNCKYPMLTSMQGNDIDPSTGKGTFSSEDGGTIKAYGNYMEGQKAFTSYQDDSVEFDAYVASSRDEQVPSSVTSKQGSHTYNNFDTDGTLYSYTPDAAADVPSVVMAKAGRQGGGDFNWEFDDAVDDESYAVNTELMAAIKAYKPSVVAIGSGFKEDSGEVTVTTTTTTTTTTNKTTTTTTSKTTAPVVVTSDTPAAGDLFCAPGATGSGSSVSDPMDVEKAIATISAGHTIFLLEGTYEFSSQILIDESNSGSAGAYKTIKAYNGADVTFDFSGQGAADPSVRGIVLDGDYWHFYGFEITKAADNGMLLSGNNNIIEMMVFNDNQDTGLQVSRYNTSAATVAEWPSYNTILNCTSKNNCDDKTMENADGFAAKLTCGEGNVFDGCMAYCNSDDGWDLYAKEETGPIGVVTIQNCVAFRNGYTEFGEGYGNCDGNGFKLGGAGVGSPHVVKNCLAFENLNCGFTDNKNPKLESLTDCTAYNNGVGGNGKSNYMTYRCTDDGCDFTNLVSYYNDLRVSDTGAKGLSISNDKFVGTIANSIYYNSKYYKVSDRVNIANGDKTGDIVTLAESDFITLSVPAMGTDFHTAWRNADGSINTAGFAETTGQYESMGYHFTGGSGPVVTTPSATTTTTTGTNGSNTTTTTTKNTNTPVAGDYIHDFTANGTSSTFFTITGNLSTSKGTVEYDGKTLTQCLKMESATSISFTNAADGTITLVFVEPAATIKVDGTKYTADGSGIITVDVAAGSHTITKADSANLFYMVYANNGTAASSTTTTTTASSGSGTTTTTTTTTGGGSGTGTTTTTKIPDDVLYGDVNADGIVSLIDVVILNKYLANAVTLNATQLANAECCVDGKLNSADVTALLKFIVELIDVLPIQPA
ncbi:MAG: dockerin type I domain-containing protein [Ruminococcus sp.]